MRGAGFGRDVKAFMATIRVYCDGAGKENDHPVITVGGFLADETICEEIERDWEAATGGHVFHLADFGTPYCELGSGNWPETQRVEFLKRLAAIVNREGVQIMSASLEVQPYNEMLAESPHAHVNGPAFSGCGQAAIMNAEYLLLKEGRRKQKVGFFFEKGDREHEISKMMQDWNDSKTSEYGRLRSHGFCPKETTLLQPADLIAGVVQRCMLSAYKALPCLDNGLSRTALHNYERYYHRNGVTAAVVSGHDRERCWIINPLTFTVLDRSSTDFFSRHPEVLKKRMKQSPFKPPRVARQGRTREGREGEQEKQRTTEVVGR
ncbi:MAG: hypothetical protein WB562_08560 [Candidatus Sulfotelmatobacter sp.]